MSINFANLDAAQNDVLTNLKNMDKGPANPSTLAIMKKKIISC